MMKTMTMDGPFSIDSSEEAMVVGTVGSCCWFRIFGKQYRETSSSNRGGMYPGEEGGGRLSAISDHQ